MKLLSQFLLFAAVCSSPLQAITVTTLIDEDDGDLIASSGAGNGISLREAINHTTAGDTITFDAALSGGTIILTNGQLLIDQDLTIDASVLTVGITIDANGSVTQHRVLEITPDNTVHLDSLTLINGVATGNIPAGDGGGIYNNHATLSLTACILSGNSANSTGAGGGAICNNGLDEGNATLNLTACTLYGNSAGRFGGGIHNRSSGEGITSLNLTACTLAGNSTDQYGGGISNISTNEGNATVDLTAHS